MSADQLATSASHSQAISKIQDIFPMMAMPMLSQGSSFNDLLNVQGIIKNLPKPHAGQVMLTINNMKEYVDGQELRIQKNMLEIDQQQPELRKKETSSTLEVQSASDHMSDMAWEEPEINPVDSVWRWDHKDCMMNLDNQKSYFEVFD